MITGKKGSSRQPDPRWLAFRQYGRSLPGRDITI